MTFTLTTDELKIVKSGSVDFSKFTDPKKGFFNLDSSSNSSTLFDGWAFSVQDAIDSGFSLEEVKTLIQNLESKGAIIGNFSVTKPDMPGEDFINNSTYLSECKKKSELEIDGNWMWTLTDEFINWVAANN